MRKWKYTSIVDFFNARVDRSGECWEWTGHFDGVGYGKIVRKMGGPSIGAHRLSWFLERGEIPCGLFVCHHCDNRKCVRVEHLFLGTQKENLRDAQRKGRLSVPSKGWERNKTHCSNGHEFNERNTYRWKNKRICRICRAMHEANRRRKMAA